MVWLAKNGVVQAIKKNLKRQFIIDIRSNESRYHYHEDGNLVLSPRYDFCFEAALRPKINPFHAPEKSYFPAKFVIRLIIIFVKGCRS